MLEISVNKLKRILVFVLLYLASMNFQAKFFYFVFASLIVLCFVQKKLVVDRASVLYLVLSIVMAVYNRSEGVFSMIRCLANVSLYFVGYNMMFLSVQGDERLVLKSDYANKTGFSLLAVIAAGSFTHYLLNFIYNYNKIIGRNTNDIWTGEIMAATGQATLACLMLGLSVAMVFAPVKKSHRYVGVACIILMLAYNLMLAGRTMLVVLFALFAVALFYTRKTLKTAYEKFKLGMGIVMSVLVLLIAYMYDLFGIRSYILSSNLFSRFGTSLALFAESSTRASSKVEFITHAYDHPFGGLHLRQKYGYAHDLLLDGYDEYGIIGFALLVAILVIGVKELFTLLRHTNYSYEFKFASLCIYVAILLMFCAEPILAGMPWLFACFCMINGCITAMNRAYFSEKR